MKDPLTDEELKIVLDFSKTIQRIIYEDLVKEALKKQDVWVLPKNAIL